MPVSRADRNSKSVPRPRARTYIHTYTSVPRISNVLLLLLLFPLFLLAGHYTGPDIQSERISFRNTIKGRKRESHPSSPFHSTSPVCASIRTCVCTYVCAFVCLFACACACVWKRRGMSKGGQDHSDGTWEGGLAEFSRPLKFRPLATCWRHARATDDSRRFDIWIIIWFFRAYTPTVDASRNLVCSNDSRRATKKPVDFLLQVWYAGFFVPPRRKIWKGSKCFGVDRSKKQLMSNFFSENIHSIKR